jgi:phosphoserine phosphatase RsbU/P
LPQIATVDFEAYYQPASEAGGDYYDVLPLTDNEVGVVIADVSGHGAPAAMNMGIARSILHTVSLSQETSPAKTLYFLNKLLCRLLGEGAYITMFYGVLNIKTYTFSWTNAGHVPALVKRMGKQESEIIGDPSSGPPLGWWDTAEFDQGTTQLNPGDLVFLYTDGATESVNIHDEMFNFDQLNDFVSASPFFEPIELVPSLVEAISEHVGEVPFQDDVTILSFKINA